MYIQDTSIEFRDITALPMSDHRSIRNLFLKCQYKHFHLYFLLTCWIAKIILILTRKNFLHLKLSYTKLTCNSHFPVANAHTIIPVNVSLGNTDMKWVASISIFVFSAITPPSSLIIDATRSRSWQQYCFSCVIFLSEIRNYDSQNTNIEEILR